MYKTTNHILCFKVTFMKCRYQSGRARLFLVLETIKKRIREDVLTAKSNHRDTCPQDSAPP